MAQKKYLALGDSYTICEGLDYKKSWPYLLSQQLSSDGLIFEQPKIIAKTGWRTDELIAAINEELEQNEKFDMVSLLIGVNNQYQEKPLSKYKKEFKILLHEAINRSKSGENGVFVVSIPDYGVTPFAKNKNKTDAIADLEKYNAYAKKLCKKNNVSFFDITPLSQKLSSDISMLYEDELHPGPEQYKAWVESFYEKIVNQLKMN